MPRKRRRARSHGRCLYDRIRFGLLSRGKLCSRNDAFLVFALWRGRNESAAGGGGGDGCDGVCRDADDAHGDAFARRAPVNGHSSRVCGNVRSRDVGGGGGHAPPARRARPAHIHRGARVHARERDGRCRGGRGSARVAASGVGRSGMRCCRRCYECFAWRGCARARQAHVWCWEGGVGCAARDGPPVYDDVADASLCDSGFVDRGGRREAHARRVRLKYRHASLAHSYDSRKCNFVLSPFCVCELNVRDWDTTHGESLVCTWRPRVLLLLEGGGGGR